MYIPTIVHNVIQFQTTVRVIHSNIKISRRSLSYVSLLTNPNSNLMSRILAEPDNFNLLSSETRYGIQFYDLQFHIVVELGLHPLKLAKSSIHSCKQIGIVHFFTSANGSIYGHELRNMNCNTAHL
jgi:hypothetical protein